MARGEKRKRNAGLGKTTTAGSQLDSGNPLRANSRTLKPAQWLGSEFQGPGVLLVHEQEDRKLVEELLGELPIEQVTRFRALVSDDDSDPDIPVRDLDNFIVFDLKKTSRPNVPPSFLEADDVSINMQGVDPVVMGLVRSTRVQSNGDDESDILDDDLNGDEERMDDMEPIALLSSSLVRVWKDDEDHNIYLQTTYAYYKLGRPHPKYLDTYSPVWIVHRVAHLVCQIIDIDAEEELSSIADIDTLIQVLQSEELVDGQGPSSNIAFEAVRIIGREITETDLHEHCKEIVFLILRMHYHPTVYETRDLDLTHPIFVDLQHLCAAISPNNPLDPPFLEDRIAEWAHHRIVSLACQILDVDASEEMKKINTIATMLRFLQNGESAQRGSANSKSFPDSVKMIGRHITIEDLDKCRADIVSDIKAIRKNAIFDNGPKLTLARPLFAALKHASTTSLLGHIASDDDSDATESDEYQDHGDASEDSSDENDGESSSRSSHQESFSKPEESSHPGDRRRYPYWRRLRPSSSAPRRGPRAEGPHSKRPSWLGGSHEQRILRKFTPLKLTGLVARNAAQFFKQVKKSGAQLSNVEAEMPDDESDPQPFGYAGPREWSISRTPAPESNEQVDAAMEVEADDEHTITQRPIEVAHHDDESGDNKALRRWVKVKGTIYKPGDFVVVDPNWSLLTVQEKDIMCSTSALSIDERANKYRFARISHIRSTTGTPNCARVHLTWMQHSSKVLQEAHHPYELFWTSTCSTIEAYRIQGLASVEVSENPTNSGTYFARRLYDAEDSSFQSIHAGCSGRSTADITEIDLISSFCPGCEKKSMRGRATGYIHTPLVDGKKRASLRMENLDYHEGDFVYIKDDDHKPISGRRNDQRSESGKLLRIAKLIGIGLVKVEASNGWKYAPRIRVSYFQRDDSGNDDRRVAFSSPLSIMQSSSHMPHPTMLHPSVLAGKCRVIHSSAWNARRDVQDGSVFAIEPHLYYCDEIWTTSDVINPAKGALALAKDHQIFHSCTSCYGADASEDAREKLEAREDTGRATKLKMLDAFSGAGGMSEGFKMSGHVDVRWGIEISPSACATFQASHPDSKVFNTDINHLLNQILDPAADDSTPVSVFGKPLPSFPRPGEVDIISLTPPCSGFSGLNRWKSAMDLRNTYIVSGFALIEHLRAPYVVVENVLNMARFPLKARDGANGALVGGIKWGTHKWIMRTFLDLGYQVRFGLLDAASFGSPQSRYRMIYVATQMGLGLPKLPTPTHLPHPEALLARKVQTPWGVPVPLATVEEPGTTKWRAHSPISVFDAIGDLPKFDWAEEGHGQNTWPTVDPQKAAENDRRCGLGKDGTVRYRTKAKTAYQQWSRGGTVEQYPEQS